MFEVTCICLALVAIMLLLKPAFAAIFDAPVQASPQDSPTTPTPTDSDIEFSSFLERVAESASMPATSFHKATLLGRSLVHEQGCAHANWKYKSHYPKPNRVISHTGRYHVRFLSKRARSEKAHKVATEIVSEVDTIHAALHRLGKKCSSSRRAPNPSTPPAATILEKVKIIEDIANPRHVSTFNSGMFVGDRLREEATTISEVVRTAGATADLQAITAVEAITANPSHAVRNETRITTVSLNVTSVGVDPVNPLDTCSAMEAAQVSKPDEALVAINVLDAVATVDALQTVGAGNSSQDTNVAAAVTTVVEEIASRTATYIETAHNNFGEITSDQDVCVGEATTDTETIAVNTGYRDHASTVDAVISFATLANVKANAVEAIEDVKAINAVAMKEGHRATGAVNIMRAFTGDDLINTVDAVKAVNPVGTNGRVPATISADENSSDEEDVFLFLSTIEWDADSTISYKELDVFSGADSHSLTIPTTIAKAHNAGRVVSESRFRRNNPAVAAQMEGSDGDVNQNMATWPQFSTHMVQTICPDTSVLSPSTSTALPSLGPSPPITPRMVRQESISTTSDTSGLGVHGSTPPRAPLRFEFLDCGVRTEIPSAPSTPDIVRTGSITPASDTFSFDADLFKFPRITPVVPSLDCGIETEIPSPPTTPDLPAKGLAWPTWHLPALTPDLPAKESAWPTWHLPALTPGLPAKESVWPTWHISSLTPDLPGNELFWPTWHIPSVSADRFTPPTTPPGYEFLDSGLQTKHSAKPNFQTAPIHPPTFGVVKQLVELPPTLTPPSTPGANDDDIPVWGPGRSVAFDVNVFDAQTACDAFEEEWLNRRLDRSINKWERAKWWTADERKARGFDSGMRTTINPEVKRPSYQIPDDIAFDVDEELDLPCGSSSGSSSDDGYSEDSEDSEGGDGEWGRRRNEMKAGLKFYAL